MISHWELLSLTVCHLWQLRCCGMLRQKMLQKRDGNLHREPQKCALGVDPKLVRFVSARTIHAYKWKSGQLNWFCFSPGLLDRRLPKEGMASPHWEYTCPATKKVLGRWCLEILLWKKWLISSKSPFYSKIHQQHVQTHAWPWLWPQSQRTVPWSEIKSFRKDLKIRSVEDKGIYIYITN